MLLERERTLAVLSRAVGDAGAGPGSVVLVTGEAGIGKTSLIQAFAGETSERARVLLSACDDLMASRPLGPLRDVLGGEPVEDIFTALLDELGAERPTVLVVEDLHWADDATLDALGYAARRIEPLGAVLVLTFRDQADARHPLHRFLGVLVGCPLHRVALGPLSRDAVQRLCEGTGVAPDALHRVTGGNPFFVTEALASPHDEVPVSVVEAVLARVGRLGPECREALDQLAVVPSRVGMELASDLLGPRFEALTEAELAGVLEIRADSLAFRHELARRAIEHSLPAIRRRRLNASVVRALRAQDRPERARLMHHAVKAGDVETILAIGPDAGREAELAGSHRQALAHYASVLPYAHRLPRRDRADLLDSYAWELYNAHRFGEAVEYGREAARLFEELGDADAVADCLVRVSRHLFMAGETDAAEESAERAVAILEPTGDGAGLAHASLYQGAILAMTDEPGRAAAILESARDLALRCGRADLAALALNYLGIARVELGDPGGLQLLRESIAAAMDARQHEYAARGYCNLGELLARGGQLEELEACVADGLRFARERGFWSHAYNLEVHRCVALIRRGRWDSALAGLRRLVESRDDPGMLHAYSVPWLGRVLARRGDPAAGEMLATAWERARRQRLLLGVAYAGLAYVEWAWLAGAPDLARGVGEVLLPRVAHPGAAPFRNELLRYLARAGVAEPVDPWPDVDDPYELAVDRVFSGDPAATVEGLRVLDGLGAAPAAALAREHLRAMGRPVPRGPRAGTPANPAGLTQRQLAVLGLVSAGMTNAEIADRLVVSVRTVDHHVAAVLDKLGVRSRRDAAAAAHAMGIDV